MRYLLALILAVPALAQQADQAAQTQPPAKAEQQAAAPAAPAASPAPSGEQWFTGSLDLGYRWLVDNNGSFPEYRSVVNLGQGLVLNGLDFTIIDPRKHLFDRLNANAFGWGGEPYESARVNARKMGVYDFVFDYRSLAMFDAVPSYANPFAPAGFNQQTFDTRRRTLSTELDFRPGKRIIPYLAFDRNSGYGHGIQDWVQDGNDEFAVPTLLRDSTDNYHGGVHFEFNKFHVTVEQGGTTYKDDDQSTWSGTNYGDRLTPIFGQTLTLTSLQQHYGIRGHSLYDKALVTAHPFSWLDLYGQFLYSDPKTTVNFNELAGGNFLNITQLLFYSSQQTIGTGAANQPHTTGNAGFELRPFRHLRIVQNWITDRYHDSAFGMLNVTPAAALGSGISTFNPLQVVNYNQEEINALYDVGPHFTVRGGYRKIWGDATTGATPFLNSTGALESTQLNRNVALAGINFRLNEKASFNIDYENGSSDDIYFRNSLNNYQKARMRGRYRLMTNLTLQATFSVLNNYNHAPSVQLDALSRDNSLSATWTPKGGKRISFSGEYDRATVHSTINYLNLPFFTPTVSDYRDNAHTVSGLMGVTLPGPVAARLTMGGSMLISNGSATTRYYQPQARLAVPVGKHVSWNTEWKYYGYQESFYLFQGFRTHIFMTGLKFSR